MTVVVDEPADFKNWLKGEKPAVPAAEAGSKVAENSNEAQADPAKI